MTREQFNSKLDMISAATSEMHKKSDLIARSRTKESALAFMEAVVQVSRERAEMGRDLLAEFDRLNDEIERLRKEIKRILGPDGGK